MSDAKRSGNGLEANVGENGQQTVRQY